MNVKCIATLILLLLPLELLAAPPPLKLPEKVTGKPGQFISIQAETTGKFVSWYSVDDGLNLFPTELLKDTHTAVVVAAQPGSYRLLAVTAAAEEVSPLTICLVVIDGPTPPPTPPLPPNPPVPPDAFTQSLQKAFTADGDTQKATRVKDLATLYRQAGLITVQDVSLKTTTDLLGIMQKARGLLMPDTAIPTVRQAVADELNKTLTTPATLDTGKRSELAALFARVATALEAVR